LDDADLALLALVAQRAGPVITLRHSQALDDGAIPGDRLALLAVHAAVGADVVAEVGPLGSRLAEVDRAVRNIALDEVAVACPELDGVIGALTVDLQV